MRIHQLSLRGITEAFPQLVRVDFEALGPGLIAIVGQNGAGKSTLIGSVFASLFRQLPGQKRPLYDFCTHAEPEIDLTFSVNSERYRSLLKMDPKARQMESYVFDSRGVALATGKKEAFAEWIRRHVGSSTLFLASLFSSQKRTGNFLGLERSQRKELFITQLLGLDRLRLIAATAKGFADQAGRKVAELEGERKGIDSVLSAEPKEDLKALERNLEMLSEQLKDLEAKRSLADGARRELDAREAARKALDFRRADLERRARQGETEIRQLREQIAGDGRLLSIGQEVKDFAAQEQTLATKVETLHREIKEAQEQELANREVESVLSSVKAECSLIEDEARRLRTESDELALVPCGGKGPYSGCIKIRRAREAQRELPTIEGSAATLNLEIGIQRNSLVTIPASSAELIKQLRECERERSKLDGLRKRAEELRLVEARRAEREATLQRLAREETVLKDQRNAVLLELGNFTDLQRQLPVVEKEIADLDGSIAAQRTERERLIVRKAQAEQQLEQIEAARTRSRLLEGELAEATVERDDYDYLATVFGAGEIQLCEIQAAGPSVSNIANALLEGCFDNNFEVSFRTQRPKADGRGYVDDFDVEVRNKTLDRSCLVDELSGGQFVLVNEAVNLGMAIYNMQQGEGIRYETLFRDETVGALDTKNAREYVRMLRHAIEVAGFHQVIFICHQPQVWELADQVLEVADGQVRVRSQAE
ncbi:MAG: hypothetical protein ACYDDI_14970 [Candidatus Acidiferrales bacterium]